MGLCIYNTCAVLNYIAPGPTTTQIWDQHIEYGFIWMSTHKAFMCFKLKKKFQSIAVYPPLPQQSGKKLTRQSIVFANVFVDSWHVEARMERRKMPRARQRLIVQDGLQDMEVWTASQKLAHLCECLSLSRFKDTWADLHLTTEFSSTAHRPLSIPKTFLYRPQGQNCFQNNSRMSVSLSIVLTLY